MEVFFGEDLDVFRLLFGADSLLYGLLTDDHAMVERGLLPRQLDFRQMEIDLLADIDMDCTDSTTDDNEAPCDENSDQSDHKPRGLGPRRSRHSRDPRTSTFYKNYIELADNSSSDNHESIWHEDSFKGKQFRNRFGVPYILFFSIYCKWMEFGEYRAPKDKVGRDRIDARVLILGVLRVLTKGIPFDLVEEVNDVSYQSNRNFFHRFVRWFVPSYEAEWVHLPVTQEEIAHVEGHYRKHHVPGCIGSIDCVHIGWDMCPAGLQSDCSGKEGYPTLAFEVISSHTRRILGYSPAFYGTWNDKIISKMDNNVKKIRLDECYTQYKWTRTTSSGEEVQETGLYFICDGGYNRWKELMPPYKHQLKGSDTEKWSGNVESLRKDVECTFGILKKRFAVLKNKLRFHHMEDISFIFKICCILHNMIHDWDGYDNWENAEEAIAMMQGGESTVFAADRMTMRDHQWSGFYQDAAADDETEQDNEFDSRRAQLIEHYNYYTKNRRAC